MPEPEIIEIHNVWTVYGLEDGLEVDTPIAAFGRPQDWGDPKWHYERFRFDWLTDKHYINHVHCWTDLVRPKHEYPHFFASLIVQILMPGSPKGLWGREYLDVDDFWIDDWGPIPPYFDPDEEIDA